LGVICLWDQDSAWANWRCTTATSIEGSGCFDGFSFANDDFLHGVAPCEMIVKCATIILNYFEAVEQDVRGVASKLS